MCKKTLQLAAIMRRSPAVVFLLSFVTLAGAQVGNVQTRPERGFLPSGSYTIGDIESINATNGNLLLMIPVAKLPPGRAGHDAGVSLVYNSALYDVSLDFLTHTSPPYGTFLTQSLERSEYGGWQYGFHYGLLFEQRELSESLNCSGGDENRFIYKMSLLLPDGSVRLLRLKGQEDPTNTGFYNLGPWGKRSPCYSQELVSSNLTYFTTDGSFIRVELPADGTAWYSKQWTICFPDGRRVQGYSDQAAKIIDRNGNEIQIINGTLSNGHPGTKLRDALNREIEIDYDASQSTGLYDYVRWTGFGANLETRITWDWLSLRNFQYPCTDEYHYCTAYIAHPIISEIRLPASGSGKPQLSYTFAYSGDSYSGYGEIKSITTPSTAQAVYDWKMEGLSVAQIGPIENAVTRKEQKYNEKYDSTTNLLTEVTTYSFTNTSSTFTHPDGGTTTSYFFDPKILSSPQRGLVYKIANPDGSVLERQWYRNKPYYVTASNDPGNPYVKTEVLSIPASGGGLTLANAKQFSYDKNGNVVELKEYDWGTVGTIPRDGYGRITGPPTNATLKRTSSSSYFNATPTAGDGTEYVPDNSLAYWYGGAPRFLRATKETRLLDGSTNKAVTQFVYDNASTTANLTQSWQWDSTKGSYTTGSTLTTGNAILTSHQYDSYGNRTQTTDPNGNVSKISYDGNSLYPATRYDAFGSTVQRQFNLAYHFATGLLTQSVDADNTITTNFSYDYLGRPTLVQEAYGVSEQRNTETDYQDDLRRVITRQGPLPSTTAKLVTVKHYDPLGRIRLTQRLENNLSESETSDTTGRKAQARYRFVSDGSVELVSNPYRASSSGGASGEETMGWTLTKRDRGGRVVSVKTYPGTNPPSPWGTNSAHTGDSTFSFDSNVTTIKDQALKERRNTIDGLGRLVTVLEAGSYTTNYTFDVLDNLTFVNQSGQTRSFAYSSLSRLTSATNPESGTTSYSYDNNGNLARKVDARNITTCFGTWNGSTCNSGIDVGYDRLNRVLRKQYSDLTPPVIYTYDTATNGKGLLRSAANSESTANYTAYDKLARVTASNQVTSGNTYSMTYSWDIADNLRSMTFPSSRTLTWSYDNAARTTGITGTKSGEANKTYASGIGYAPHDGLASLAMGNSMAETWNYNSRLQPRQVSAVRSGTTHLSLGFFYCGSQVHTCSDNNGNMRIQTLGIPGQSWTQSFGYDGVNRLSSVSETGGAGWSQSFGYDTWGNRWVSAYTNLVPQPQTPATSSWYNTANNRLKSAGYDLAGNQTTLGALTMMYDAEGRTTQAQKSVVGQSWTTQYKYDGDGRRVKKLDAAGATTVFVYDATGNLAAEYYSGSVTATKGVDYLTADHLGSTRMISNESGTIVARRDYQPFGEEIPSSIGGRPGLYDTQTEIKQQFTGKERDAETGLDYFESRYFSAVQGRFTSTDPIISGLHKLSDPQDWNLYSYARSNPLRFTDPTGEIIEEQIDDEYKKRYDRWKKEYLSTAAGRKQWDKYANDPSITLTITFDKAKKQGAEAGNYQWDSAGNLRAATITLGPKLDSGFPSSVSYPITSSLQGASVSGTVLAVTKFAHEFGHVNRTGQENAALYQLQNQLIPQYNSLFFSIGRNPSHPGLRALEQQMGGTPIDISIGREHWAEANTVPYLRDRFPAKSMPKQIKQAIENYQKTYPGRVP
jgi:RHS repeat-associated protein